MKKINSTIALMAVMALFFSVAIPVKAAGPATWDTTGTYTINVNYLSVDYPETLILAQTGSAITGTSLDTVPPGSLFTVTGGTVSGNAVSLSATQGSLTINMLGTIAANGSMTGTWADVAPGTRTGTWTTTSGAALPLGTLAAQDFGVVNYNTGATGQLAGYTAGFGLTDATLADTTSVVVKLYNGATLLQTNTAIMSAFGILPGAQFSSPFDVSGNFAYATDGYWTNVREVQYGQSVPATKVTATVTLSNGKIVTAENDVLTGDPTTIYPVVANVTTNPATSVVNNDAVLNGTNGPSAAIGHSFWVSLATFPTTSPSIPAGVYSTPDMGAIVANTAFSATLSSITTTGVPTNLPAITPNTTYYYAAWSNVGGTWYPGAVLSFTTAATVTPPVTQNLTVTLAGTGTGVVTSLPAGINCGITCTSSFANNAVVTLTEVPAVGSTFTGYSGACTGTGACIVTMSSTQAVTATFALKHKESDNDKDDQGDHKGDKGKSGDDHGNNGQQNNHDNHGLKGSQGDHDGKSGR